MSQALSERLRAGQAELEQTALARTAAIADRTQVADPSYVAGLRTAIAAAVDYGLAALTEPEREPLPVPVELLAQARLAARNGVSLEAVVRRYSAGHGLLADRLLEEAIEIGASAADLRCPLRALASRYDRVIAAVGAEHRREAVVEIGGPKQRRNEMIRRLLAGEPLDTSPLGYDFEAHQLALVAVGEGIDRSLEQLRERLDRLMLSSEPSLHTVWAWFGGRRPFELDELDLIAGFSWPEGSTLACGEPGRGLSGWRLSHRQAAAALPVAQRAKLGFALYSDVSLLAAVLQDDLLADSLRQAYLDPLAAERKDGRTAKTTLRAYFEAARNISSAAARLGVSRRTVASRLAAVERRLGSSIDAVASELEVALQLDEIEALRTDAPDAL